MAYDDVLVTLGQFGRYQKRINFLLCLPAISCALHKLAGVFLQARVDHRCIYDGESENATFFDLSVTNKCTTNISFTDNSSLATCPRWLYDTSQYSSTTTSEFDLVCDRAWLRATGDALLMVGVMLGSIIFGDLSDRLGRKPVFFVSLILQVVFGLATAVVQDVYAFMISRMIVGATTSGVFLVAYVIGLEMVGPSKRILCGVVFQLFFTAGFILTAGFAYLIRDWRTLQIAITLPGVAYFCYWWFIPESVRWQLTKGKTEEAKKTLRAVAKENGQKVCEDVLEQLCQQTEAERKQAGGKTPSVLELFKYRNLAQKSVIIFFLWFVNSATYYGLSWNTSNLGGNDYVNFIISGLVEIPAYSLLLFTLDRWGRKPIVCGAMLISGSCLIISGFIPRNLLWLNITFAMAGKLAITSSYGAIYVWTTEQFPTVIRNAGLGAASTFARVGGILAPYVNIMVEIWTPLPMIVFGVMAFISGASALLLPETLGKDLPETIADGENFGK
ncbi:unnamed protein product [Nesidiocoris tenuis]|nr:unnamed protein product [Nesidiocoris tenuis]